ncbi:hypothetical protein EJ08DRAFT_651768 [Tothia fuscella]|uniref:Glycosyl transferase CAP10 domain-containing protein n=1 Tax=Tothia fuscella TaxID=1048955 RepID=A0A9P4NLJ0_9PEZI|nr:hypothetical protein EJ08DRAFT_651768 [Tothia fuscella]
MAKAALIYKLPLPIAIFSTFLTVRSFPTSIAYERPIHTIIFAFAVAGFLLANIGRSFPGLFSPSPTLDVEHDHCTIVLQSRDEGVESQNETPTTRKQHENGLGPTTSRVVFIGAIIALSLRVELYRRISNAPECTVTSPEVFLPVICAIYETSTLDKRDSSRLQNLCHHWFRYIPSAFGISVGCYLLLSTLWDATGSTYICPRAGRESTSIPGLQVVGTIIDGLLAIATVELSRNANSSRSKGPLVWGAVLIATAAVWCTIGVAFYFGAPELRSWLLPFELMWNADYVFSQLFQTLLLSGLCICAFICVVEYGLSYTAIALTAVCVLTPSMQFVWTRIYPFPPISPAPALVAFFLIYSGWRTLEISRKYMGLEKQVISAHRRNLLLFIFVAATYPVWSKSNHVEVHPIENLMHDAEIQHEQYVKGVKLGNSLQDAVAAYKQRYNMNPPPGFHIWYEYATNSSTTIIDEFDQIYNDLLPFRMTSPEDLRRQTWEMVSNPWNGISGITIRNGEAKVQDNVIPTHRWMLEGVVHLIEPFARFLPDMDLAFNLNDESRVVVPYADMTTLKDHAPNFVLQGTESFSSDRSNGWLPIPESDYDKSIFIDAFFQNSFSRFGSVGCHPKSAARRNPRTSSSAHLCFDCIKPHSDGLFVRDWSVAADPCHQPDLSHLHGFYLSPAAFRTSHKLMPVFSQSKPHSYNDILYPSAWNYMDKVKYSPSEEQPDDHFRSKDNTLFWRGATSEGVSASNKAWHGMTRQRLVHMTNNATYAQHDRVTMLLPDGDRYKYRTLAGPTIKDLGLSADIAIVDGIARCRGRDCDNQVAEFALVSPTDFQSHWKYRYLFDLDGAGFSGRFLPFLQSRSLPFKTALFREWYDSRLTAWHHFVPQDIRLHGVWSTLAYFAGIDGWLNGKRIVVAPHLDEGERIASNGREWSYKVLRKEDMELYFFRLLLEWGRLTDDRRDSLGFSV